MSSWSGSGRPNGLAGNNDRNHKESFWQFVKFNLVGVMNTGVDFAVFTLLVWLGTYYLTAQCISYAAGTLNSYFVNKFWTFRERESRERKGNRGQFIRFAALNVFSLALSLGLLYLMSHMMGLPPLLSKVVVTGFTTVVNFAGSKLWVFSNGEDKLAREKEGLQ